MVCKHLTADPLSRASYSESSNSQKKLPTLGVRVSGQMCPVLASKRHVECTAGQDLGIGLVLGDQATHQARLPACPPLLLYLELTAHTSPTAVGHKPHGGSGIVTSKHNNQAGWQAGRLHCSTCGLQPEARQARQARQALVGIFGTASVVAAPQLLVLGRRCTACDEPRG